MKLCHKMKVYRRGDNGTSRPEIRLLGQWLDKAGFSIGQEICVTIQDDRIVIEKGYTEEEKNLNDVYKYFEREEKSLKEETDMKLFKWVRAHGYIKSNETKDEKKKRNSRKKSTFSEERRLK